MENGDGYSIPAARRPPPVREDCWSEEATETLVEAWERFLELNRGNLRQHHWQEVADAVNARHGHVSKHRRSDVQCKNRIDTLKKKYKTEKARVSDGAPATWRFFPLLDRLLGTSYKLSPVPVTAPVPVRPRSKRPSANFLATVAVGDRGEDGEESESGKSRTSGGDSWQKQESPRSGYGEVAEAIERLGEIYERVEEERQRHMVELEKQRMKFAKDLEIQRMELFMESQIQMEKIRQANRNKNKRVRPDDEDGGEGILSSFYCLFDV